MRWIFWLEPVAPSRRTATRRGLATWMIARLLPVLICIALATQCARREYGVAIRNMTTNDIEEAHVTFDGFRSVGGGIEPGLYVVHMDVGRPVPESAVVEWKAGGTRRSQTVRVRDVVPSHFHGDIYFDIMPDGSVHVVPRTEAPPLPSALR